MLKSRKLAQPLITEDVIPPAKVDREALGKAHRTTPSPLGVPLAIFPTLGVPLAIFPKESMRQTCTSTAGATPAVKACGKNGMKSRDFGAADVTVNGEEVADEGPATTLKMHVRGA